MCILCATSIQLQLVGTEVVVAMPASDWEETLRFRCYPAGRCPKESLARNGSRRSPVGHEKQERSFAIWNPVSRLNGRFPARSGHWPRQIGLRHPANCGRSHILVSSHLDGRFAQKPAERPTRAPRPYVELHIRPRCGLMPEDAEVSHRSKL